MFVLSLILCFDYGLGGLRGSTNALFSNSQNTITIYGDSMTNKIKYALVSTMLVFATIAKSHSVDEHQHHPERAEHATSSPHSIERSSLTVADLIKAYSRSGDDELLELGWERVLLKLESANPSVETFLQAAWLSQAQHQFDSALRYADRVLMLQPNNSQAWLLTASIFTVQGKLSEARAACQQVSLSLSPLVALACSARLSSGADEQRLALQRLQRLLELDKLTLNTELTPWVQSIAADLASQLAQPAVAKQFYIASIDTFPSVQVRSAYADLLLSQQDYDQVLKLIFDDEATPALRIRRLLAEQNLGHDTSTAREHVDQLFRSWAAVGDYRHAREMAMFYLELEPDLSFAYHLANKNIQIQREPEDQKILQEARQRLADNRI